ncbi:hypothetical protein CHGG_10931 [Chaetomium globosum CBS 148.51]|uniref:SET domain-containing protein n=1 Tax=Chaetomium globosum (strain ATCC 6205 / CBS 148.51 / DSM 1962 / NBRC 6347 / NRRL 1970) TaxID=306901 RepID=Q2GM73_CHAGB|nr:uncharacterized protein CHGG_10931 [Chaetomium globosum CBS 148.51]EAQ83113.1 hypothetical protein CHGG_10931 [Chaetomium globosum CBS 148.51]
MTWLKAMLRLESTFRAQSRLAQSAVGQLESHFPLAFEIRSSPGKGLGVFATKNIPRDAVIMRDPLVFRAERGEELADLHHKFTMLPTATRQKILELSVGSGVHDFSAVIKELTAQQGGDEDCEKALIELFRLEDIIAENAFNAVPHNIDSASVLLYLNASRLNHSCIPNADPASKDDTSYMVMRANRDINAGEEITSSYILRVVPRATRLQQLSKGWGFTCQCPACDPKNPFSDSHERRLKALLQLYTESACYMNKEGRLKDAERSSYGALKQAADRAKRQIEMLSEHHSLRVFSRESCLGALDIAIAKYKLKRLESDLEEALKLLELIIEADKLYHGEITIGAHEELYKRLRRGDISSMWLLYLCTPLLFSSAEKRTLTT